MDWPTAAVVLGTTLIGCLTWLRVASAPDRRRREIRQLEETKAVAAQFEAIAASDPQQIAEALAERLNGLGSGTVRVERNHKPGGRPTLRVYIDDVVQPTPNLPDPWPGDRGL